MKLTNDTYLILISSAGSARETSCRVVMPWPWNRRSSARRSRQRRLLTNNAKATTARSAAVGMETSSPAISVDLIGAGYGGIVPKTLRPTANCSLPERRARLTRQAPLGPGS